MLYGQNDIITYTLTVSVMFFLGKAYGKALGCSSCSDDAEFV